MRIRGTLLGMALGLLAASRSGAVAPCPPDSFLEATTVDMGGAVRAVAIGEFTGDAFNDVLASVDGIGMVLLPGNGDGTFGAPIVVDPAVWGDALVAADFDGNGALDFAIGGGGGTISVYFGNGNGAFAPPVAYQATGGGIERLIAADLTGDGRPDLATVGGADVVVLENDGNGGFSPPVRYQVEHASFSLGDLAAGDLDGDGATDIVASGDQLYILHNKGDGSFEPGASIPAGYRLWGVAVGDVNGDGHADIGFSHQDQGADNSPGYVGILLNNGDGTFQAAVDTPIASQPGALVLQDLDGDGRADGVAMAAGLVEILRSSGGASFSGVTGYFSGDGVPAVGDLDGNGLADIVTGNSRETALSVLFGNGGARLRSLEQIVTPVGTAAVVTGDFDGDGVPDAAVRGALNAETVLLGGNGDGTFRPPILIDAASSDVTLAAGDFDGDGHLDLVVGGDLLLGNGDGTFRQGGSYSVSAFGTGDFNGDGRLDLAGRTGSDVAVLLGHGDGTLSSPITSSVSIEATKFVVSEFNGDAKSDLAFFEQPSFMGNGSLHVWLSNGDGTFTESYAHDTGQAYATVFAADVTGEGHTDLLTAEDSQGTRLYVGHGDGTFDDPVVLDADIAIGVVAADFDGDGIVDVVISAAQPYTTKFLKGLGGGAFAPPVPLPSPGQNNGVVDAVALLSGRLPDVLLSPDGGNTSFGLLVNSRLSPMIADHSVIVGAGATLGVAASGRGALTYQWRRDGVPLADGGTISGSATSRLVIDPVFFDDARAYDVLVTDDCGSVASNVAQLTVEFADVPVSSPFHADILAIATAGITSGCGGGNYCPTSPVRRDQMAVFLLKSEHGSSYAPPTCTGVFTDVPCPSPFADWVEQLSIEGVTSGCGGGNYCPGASVTRAQMAVFLLKTKNGSSYVPPPAVGLFGDVPVGSFAADFIEALYNAGITGGCQASPLLYCPGNSVLRQQMATFLVRTF